MSGNGLSINDLLSIFDHITGKQGNEKLEQIKPLAETLTPLIVDLLKKWKQSPNNDSSINDLVKMLNNAKKQKVLTGKNSKKIERGLKKALDKDGINGVLEYLAKELQADLGSE